MSAAAWLPGSRVVTMAIHTDDGGDSSKHLVIRTDIRIAIKKPTKTSKRLEVKLNSKRVKLSHRDKEVQNGLEAHRWTLQNEIHVLPDDIVTLQVTYDKRRRCFITRGGMVEEVEVSYGDIVKRLKEPEQAMVTFDRPNHTITLEVTRGDITNMVSSVSVKDLDGLLPDRIEELISSNESFSDNVKELRSIFEYIPVTEDAWKIWEDTIKTLGKAHPLAKAVVTAISIPYNFLKNERDFKDNVKDLADVMQFTCKCLVDIRYHIKITSAKETFVSIMRTLQNAAVYINDYMSKGKIDQVLAAQFPAKLEEYAEDLVTLKNDFQMAMVMQVARDADKIVSMSSDDFLQKRLGPVGAEELRLGDSCMEGTRVNILREVRSWLQDDESKNILWLVGAPGAGKSTISTTIAKKPADTVPFCAKFFCKRDVEGPRDPHRVWRTIAYGLASRHDGVKSALMRTLEEKKVDPQDYSVIDQFEELIKGPLETDKRETGFRGKKIPYPLIIIDALDECYSANNDDWKSLLESLGLWARLLGTFKLMITSRDVQDIRETLGPISRRIDLTTGNNVSDESKRDVSTFFTQKFTLIKKEHVGLRSRSSWPGIQQLQELADYAAGLFIWADMVIKYVGHRTSGNNPEQRLESVLSDINARPSNRRGGANAPEGSNQVDRLYARIVFEAFRHSEPREQRVAKQILAAIVLAMRPLRKRDLVDLFTTDASESGDILVQIESTLQELSPIIPIVQANDDLRVCHKTVSDFLLSRQRSTTAMEYVVHKWNRRRSTDRVSDPLSFVMDGEAEHWNLALACVHLLRRYFAKEVEDLAQVLKQNSNSLEYACSHWSAHLESAGAKWMPDFGYLASAIKIAHGCLRRYAGDLLSVKEETEELMKRLWCATDYSSKQIYNNSDQVSVDLKQDLVVLTKNLDIARGNFQIAMILFLVKDVDASTLNKADASETFLRKRLQPSDQTELDEKCLDGTRTSVIERAKDWLTDSGEQNILWIFGAPGSGKSAVATTLVDEFRKLHLCAKVFAKRDFAERRDTMLIWRTLAYDLTSLHVGLKGSMMEAVHHGAPSFQNTPEDQLRSWDLVANMLRQQQYLSVVTIFDALDECFSDDNAQWRIFLDTLANWNTLPRSFKLVVTSRDLPNIRSALEKVSLPICLATGNDASQEERRDIQRFLRRKLAEISSESIQLNEDLVEELTGYAGGSFIWAKMVVALVPKVGTVNSLKNLLKGVRETGDIDILYGHLLLITLGRQDEKRRNITRSFLAALVLARDPLRKNDLAELTYSNEYSLVERRHLVDSMVEDLGSIISVDDEQRLRIPHKSLSDFLLDQDRSFAAMRRVLPSDLDEDLRSYLVDIEGDSTKLCVACLNLMTVSLKFNACDVKTSYALNDNSLIQAGGVSEIIGSSLLYACRFWSEHLKLCDHSGQQRRSLVEPLLKPLLQNNFLYWLEILSHAKVVPSAITSLDIVTGVLEGWVSELAEVAKDGRLFVKMFEEPIASAVPHIYLSALPFCPSNSCITKIYGPQYPNLVSVVRGRRVGWDALPTGNARDKTVTGVAFCPDGGKIVSGSADGTVRVWDAESGELHSEPMSKCDGAVWCIAVSRRGSKIAAGENNNLRFWDGNTDSCLLGSLEARGDGRSNNIWSVALSPDGSRIVTGSGDCTVRVWDATSSNLCLSPLTGHSEEVYAVTFSPDGTTIVSGSRDKTIRIWDAPMGESRMEPSTVHTDAIQCVTFSPDGRYLASSSDDKTFRLWDVQQQFSETSSFSFESGVFSLSFSPDSTRLVSGSVDGALRFWSVTSEGGCKEIGVPISAHFDAFWCVSFAPDGQSVASSGRSIKLWTVPSTTGENRFNTPALESLDAHGHAVFSDEAYIDKDGWMRASRKEGADALFWIPKENREGVWWPRNTAVIHQAVTRFDFSRFVHGENWTECRALELRSEVANP